METATIKHAANVAARTAIVGAAQDVRRAIATNPHGFDPEFPRGYLAACDIMERYARIFEDTKA